MIVREYDYIKGSTATNPSRKSKVRKLDKKNKELQRAKKSRNVQLKNKQKNDRKYILTVAIVIFSLGCITIFGDSKVYTMQRQVSDFNTQIKQTQEDNEALKVKLLKFSSLSNIQEHAEKKLGMAITSKENIVKVDFSENYFENVKQNDETQKKEQKNIFSKLISLIK